MSSVAPSSSPPSSSTPDGSTVSGTSTSSLTVHTSAQPPSSAGDTRAVPTATTLQPPSAAEVATLDHSSPSSSGDHKFSNGSSVSGTASSSKGKRVFVFQKRWLHSLPIMEKTLPESADVKKKRNADETGASSSTSSPTGSSATVNDSGESSRDVIACMLCDEPGSTSHHLTRVWSRMNCRRGRIENHLMSKHPEFMLLLKHKRDTEGDLSVQLFLQGMRDGRCNIRSEINLGLYNHIQTLNAHANADASSSALASLTSAGFSASNNASSSSTDAITVASAGDLTNLQQSVKRGFPGANVYTIRDGGLATNGNDKMLSVFPSLGGAAKTEFLELENRNKRARLEAAPPSLPVSSDGASTVKGQNVPLPSGATGSEGATQSEFPVSATVPTLEASVFTQWQSVFHNKLVVVTGGENEFITSLATNLWLLGANVLLTFTNITALSEFMTRHGARFPDADTSSSTTGAAAGAAASHRGVMLSMLCAFHTRRQIDEWSKSVADKYSRVDFLINFVDEEEGKRKSGSVAQDQGDSQQSDSHQQQLGEDGGSAGEYLVSSANRLLELCQSISKLCFQSSGAGSIINITTQSDGVRRSMNCAAVESMTKSLALELQPLSVQVNCILLQQISPAATTTESEQQQQPQQQGQQNAALSHTILFLLSPASASVSGSVLRLQHRATSSQPLLSSEVAGSGSNAPSAPAAPVAIQTADSSTSATTATSSDPEARAQSTTAQVEQQVLI